MGGMLGEIDRDSEETEKKCIATRQNENEKTKKEKLTRGTQKWKLFKQREKRLAGTGKSKVFHKKREMI